MRLRLRLRLRLTPLEQIKPDCLLWSCFRWGFASALTPAGCLLLIATYTLHIIAHCTLHYITVAVTVTITKGGGSRIASSRATSFCTNGCFRWHHMWVDKT
jgi:hypothetical protein